MAATVTFTNPRHTVLLSRSLSYYIDMLVRAAQKCRDEDDAPIIAVMIDRERYVAQTCEAMIQHQLNMTPHDATHDTGESLLMVNADEHAAILAGLRLLQVYITSGGFAASEDAVDIARDSHGDCRVTVEQLDTLCERINS